MHIMTSLLGLKPNDWLYLYVTEHSTFGIVSILFLAEKSLEKLNYSKDRSVQCLNEREINWLKKLRDFDDNLCDQGIFLEDEEFPFLTSTKEEFNEFRGMSSCNKPSSCPINSLAFIVSIDGELSSTALDFSSSENVLDPL